MSPSSHSPPCRTPPTPLGFEQPARSRQEVHSTSISLIVYACATQGKANLKQLIKNWVWSYLGNVVGSIAFAYLVFMSGVLAAPSLATVKGMAVAKTGLAFMPAFYRGILCNWLVCIGIWQATAAKDIASKAIGIWFPISAFVAMGFEHSVANMFFLPTALFNGADVTWKVRPLRHASNPDPPTREWIIRRLGDL